MSEAPRKIQGKQLLKVKIDEVAMVDEGANNHRFHLLKRLEGGDDIANTISELDALIPDSDADGRKAINVLKARLLKQGEDDAAKAPEIAALAAQFTASLREGLAGVKTELSTEIKAEIKTQLEAMQAGGGSDAASDAGDNAKANQGADDKKGDGKSDQADDDPLADVDQAEIDAFIEEQADAEVQEILS